MGRVTVQRFAITVALVVLLTCAKLPIYKNNPAVYITGWFLGLSCGIALAGYLK
jgi:hypothetical protein